MGRSGVNGDLFITVGGDVTPLRTAMRAGKSVLNEFGSAAIDVQVEVAKAFADMASNAPAAAKQLEAAYASTFAQIRRNAQAALDMPTGTGAVAVLNAAGAREAATAAEAEAAALRMVADAAARADAAETGANAGTRAYAVAAEAAAQQSASYAAGLRGQAQVLGQVEAALIATLPAEQRLNAARSMSAAAANSNKIAQMELMHVVRGSMDQIAAGAPLTQVLAMHMSMLSQAASFAGQSMGKFGQIMGGPWGIAITAGITLLSLLISKHGQAKKSAEEHRTAEEQLIAYINGEKIATDALVESLIKLNEQESKSIDLKDEAIRKTIDLTKATLDHAQANRAVLNTQLTAAKATAAAAAQRQATATGHGLEAAAGEAAAAQAEVDRLQRAVNETDEAIAQATATISTDIVKLARNLATHVDQANDLFDKKQAELEAKYRGTATQSTDAKGRVVTTLHGGLLNAQGLTDQSRKQLTDELAKAEHDLSVQRAKAVDAARELDKAEVGQVETAHEAISKFREAVIGAEGTGANRLGSSASGVGQFMPGTWLTYFKKAYPNQASSMSREAILAERDKRDVAGGVIEVAAKDYAAKLTAAGQQVTEASLYTVHLLSAGSKNISRAVTLLTAPAGENTNKFLPASVLRGNPFLRGTAGDARAAIAQRIGDSGSAVSSGAVALQKQLEDEAQRQRDQRDTFDRASAQLDDQTLSARKELLGGYDTQASIQSDEIEAARQSQRAAIQKQLDDNKITRGQAIILDAQVDELADAKQAVADRREYLDALSQAADHAKLLAGFQLDDLKFADDMAKTESEKRRIQLQIIDIQYKLKQAELEHLLQVIQSNKDFATSTDLQNQAADIQAQIARLPTDRAHDQARAVRGTMNPLQQYFDDIPHNADQINQALQSIEVQGIDGLANALSHAGEGWKSMRDIAIQTLQEITQELIKLAIQRMIFNLFGNAILGGVTGGAGGAATVGGGGGAFVLGGGTANFFAHHPFGGFAIGGFVSGPGGPTSDSIPAMLSDGEYVLNAAAVRKFGTGFLDQLNEGRIPHRKHGGFLSILPFLAGGLFGALTGRSPLLMAGLIGGGFSLADKIHGPLGDILKFAISPAAFLGEKLLGGHHHSSSKVPDSMLSAVPPTSPAANNNDPISAGDNHYHITVAGTGDPLKDRQTGMQYAAGMDEEMSRRRRKGTI